MPNARYQMELVRYLSRQKTGDLLMLLLESYRALDSWARARIFGAAEREARPERPSSRAVLQDIRDFDEASRGGAYYEPPRSHSSFVMGAPEKTRAWCDLLARLAEDTVRIFEHDDPATTAACFRILFPLLDDAMAEDGIVFAEELGVWMIPYELDRFYTAGLRACGQHPEGDYVDLATRVLNVCHRFDDAGDHFAAMRSLE